MKFPILFYVIFPSTNFIRDYLSRILHSKNANFERVRTRNEGGWNREHLYTQSIANTVYISVMVVN